MSAPRTQIREELKTIFEDFISPYFTSYPTVNIKDYDIAGLDQPDYYPIVNIVTLDEDPTGSSPIGKEDKAMNVIIDVIPWADEVNGMEECDKVFSEIPSIIYSNPQWSSIAIDTQIGNRNILRLGTDCPTLKVRFELIITYREARPL